MKYALPAFSLIVLSGTAHASECQIQPSDIRISEDSTLFARLASIDMKKDQFETEEQYQARLKSKIGQAIPQLDGAVVAIEASASNALKYDAERQRLTLPSLAHERYALGSIKPFGTGKGYHGGYVYRVEQAPSSYAAQNGFGASAEILVRNRSAVGFAWDPNVFKMSNNGSWGSPSLTTLQLPPSEARELAQNAKYVVRGRPVFPFIFTEEMTFGRPTFNDPTETRQITSWFFIEPIAVCLTSGDKVINEWSIKRK